MTEQWELFVVENGKKKVVEVIEGDVDKVRERAAYLCLAQGVTVQAILREDSRWWKKWMKKINSLF